MTLTLDPRRRLHLGLGLALALLWLYALLELSDWAAANRAEVTQLETEIARMHLIERETYWPEVRAQSLERLEAFRARAWHQESEGLIQAFFQDWLRGQLERLGVQVRELTVSLPDAAETETPSAPDLRMVRARLTLEFQVETFQALIRALSADGHWIWVEHLVVRNWGRPALELDLGALFVIGPGPRPE